MCCKESSLKTCTEPEASARLQACQMKHALPVVADLSGGDTEMQRIIQETIGGLGGLDIIVNK